MDPRISRKVITPKSSDKNLGATFPEKMRSLDSRFSLHLEDTKEMYELALRSGNVTLLAETKRHLRMIIDETVVACPCYRPAIALVRFPDDMEYLCTSGANGMWLETPHCLKCVMFDWENNPIFFRVAEGAD